MPRMTGLCVMVVMVAWVSGCDSQDKTRLEIKMLEATGQIPTLDRSDSLMGPDVNHDGIRDDVEAYIEAHFAAEPAQRMAARQLAKAVQQSILIEHPDTETARKAFIVESKAMDCIDVRFPQGTIPKAANVIEEIIAVTTNTKKRLKASMAIDQALGGTVFPLDEEGEEACE